MPITKEYKKALGTMFGYISNMKQGNTLGILDVLAAAGLLDTGTARKYARRVIEYFLVRGGLASDWKTDNSYLRECRIFKRTGIIVNCPSDFVTLCADGTHMQPGIDSVGKPGKFFTEIVKARVRKPRTVKQDPCQQELPLQNAVPALPAGPVPPRCKNNTKYDPDRLAAGVENMLNDMAAVLLRCQGYLEQARAEVPYKEIHREL